MIAAIKEAAGWAGIFAYLVVLSIVVCAGTLWLIGAVR